MTRAEVFKAGQHAEHQYIATANCFFYPGINVEQVTWALGKQIGIRPSRIEVTDAPAPLHSHAGITVVFVAAGYGVFQTTDGEIPIGPGDVIVIPPGVDHLSVAAPHTTLIEYSIFIGDPQDFSAHEA